MCESIGRMLDRFMGWRRWEKLAAITGVFAVLIGTPLMILEFAKDDDPIVLVLSGPPTISSEEPIEESFSPETPPSLRTSPPSSKSTMVSTEIIKEDSPSYIETQRIALEYLYNMTDGDNWKDRKNWLDPKRPDVCTWHGIACDINTGYVREIKLTGSLNGAIPSELGLIHSLKALRFHGHDLRNIETGQSLPAELSQLTNLKHLQFSTCRLQGTFPPSYGSSLTSLEVLDLRWNDIESGIPNSISIGMKKNLRRFLFRYNNLRFEIPTAFGELKNLQELDLFAIKDLTGTIPTELGLLDQLQVLNLGGTAINGNIPVQLDNLTSLRELTLPKSIAIASDNNICQKTNVSIYQPESSCNCCSSSKDTPSPISSSKPNKFPTMTPTILVQQPTKTSTLPGEENHNGDNTIVDISNSGNSIQLTDTNLNSNTINIGQTNDGNVETAQKEILSGCNNDDININVDTTGNNLEIDGGSINSVGALVIDQNNNGDITAEVNISSNNHQQQQKGCDHGITTTTSATSNTIANNLQIGGGGGGRRV